MHNYELRSETIYLCYNFRIFLLEEALNYFKETYHSILFLFFIFEFNSENENCLEKGFESWERNQILISKSFSEKFSNQRERFNMRMSFN